MQSISRHLAFLLGKRMHFKIKFKQYDGALQVFYPNYTRPAVNVQLFDVVAWIWGDALKIGYVVNLLGNRVQVTMITRKNHSNSITAYVNKIDMLCIFQPK